MRFQRQLGGLKDLEIRGHGTLWFHLLSSPLHLLFETRSFNELFLTTSIYVGRSSCDLRRRKKTWLFLPHLFQAVRSERLFNARSPRKSTKRQSKVGSKWVNKSIMKEWKQNLCFLFLNWLRPLNHLGITKWRCVWAYRDLWTWLDPRCRPREDWRWPRKKRKTRSMLFFLETFDGRWKISGWNESQISLWSTSIRSNIGQLWMTFLFRSNQTASLIWVKIGARVLQYIGSNFWEILVH